MWKLVALLPCLLLVAQVKADCSTLLACESEVSDSSLFNDEASLASYANEADALDAVCTELSGLTTCIDNNLNTCDNQQIKNKIKTAKDIVVYMCSESGREAILNISQSECNDDPTLETQMAVVMQGCLEDYQFDVQMAVIQALMESREFQPSEVCPFAAELGTCVSQGAGQLCGPAMEIFIQNIWNIAAADQFAQFGCASSAAAKRHALKRAIPMLLKKSAMIKKYRK